MRRTLLVLVVIFSMLCCFACGNSKNEDVVIEYESGIYHNKDWSDPIGTYRNDVIPDEETALEVAKAIYEGMENNEDEREYVPQHVFYDTQDEVWIVSFWKWENTDIRTVGGCCSIAMQKKDGKVLRIWAGE